MTIGISALLGLIRKSQKAVPAVKFALGVVGIAAAAAAVSIILGHTRTSIILVALMFVGMVILFLFSKLVSSDASSSIQAAANVVLWTVVIVFSATLLLGLSAVAAGWPPRLVEFLFPKSELSNSDLLQKVIARDSVTEADDAIAELSRRCEKGCEDRSRITKTLATALRHTGHVERELNVAIVFALKKLWNNDLQQFLENELENAELVEVDFSNANLSGISLKGAFVILSKFRNANLSSADFTDTSVRGSDFRGATFKHTSMGYADWFNGFNLEKSQVAEFSGNLLKCPRPLDDPSFASFINEVNKRYGLKYEGYSLGHQQQLKENWQKYSAPGGLCEYVESRK